MLGYSLVASGEGLSKGAFSEDFRLGLRNQTTIHTSICPVKAINTLTTMNSLDDLKHNLTEEKIEREKKVWSIPTIAKK